MPRGRARPYPIRFFFQREQAGEADKAVVGLLCVSHVVLSHACAWELAVCRPMHVSHLPHQIFFWRESEKEKQIRQRWGCCASPTWCYLTRAHGSLLCVALCTSHTLGRVCELFAMRATSNQGFCLENFCRCCAIKIWKL